MKKIDFDRFVLGIGKLGEVFDSSVSKNKAEIYFEVLSDLSIEDFEKGINQILHDRVYSGFPKPAEIRQVCEGTKNDKALLQCVEFRSAIRNIGSMDCFESKDPITNKVMQSMGGWAHCCLNIDWDRFGEKEFINLYEAYARLDPGTEYPQLEPAKKQELSEGIK